MRRQTAVLAICLLLLLALAPWLISSCGQRPLLPDELRQARTAYEARVDVAQAATMEAHSQGDSIRKVIALGTVAVTVDATAAMSLTATATPTITTLAVATATLVLPSPTAIVAPAATITQRATRGTTHGSSVVIVRTTVLTPTVVATVMTAVTNSVTTTASITATITATDTVTPVGTTRVVVVRANATPAAPSSAPINGRRVPEASTRPLGLVASVDVITEEMLTEQMQQDASDAGISDLTVSLTPNGFSALGNIAIRPALHRPVAMHADFVVENDSLVAKVTSIDFGGLDVTDQYASDLEGRINWGLYQLLPQRYVDAFELGDGQVTVQSQRKP